MDVELLRYHVDKSDFQLGKSLGQGACGKVYMATDKRTGQTVALKVLHDTRNDQDIRMFLREVAVPLKVKSEGIVHVLGFSLPSEGKEALIVTEFMANGTLADVMKKKFSGTPEAKFGPTEWSKALYGIAHTMRQVHRCGAMHRDLKGENVFLDENYEIRIADFGLSKMIKDSVQNTLQIGSPLFMAPELLNDGDGNYDKSVDVYAFAVLVYQTFTKSMQLDRGGNVRSPQQLMLNIMRGARLKRVPEIPDIFWALITRCWDQNPVSRPTFDEIVEEMDKCQLVIAKTDMAKYNEYRDRLKSQEVPPAAGLQEFLKSRAKTHGPPTVADLAGAGDPWFQKIYMTSLQRSMRSGTNTQEWKPYKFL